MKYARLCSIPCWLALTLCPALLAAETSTAGAGVTGDGSSRAHTIELGINDLRLRQEDALPSLEDPTILTREDSPCLLPEPSIACPRRAELNLAPTTSGDDGSLHRLRRDTREAQAPHDPGHLIEESLERMAEPPPD